MTRFDEIARSSDRPIRHHVFYFDDGNLVLDVQGTLFRIHKYFLTRHSPVFENLFRMKSSSSNLEGSSDKSPITLQGDDPVDFCRLFRLFYHDEPGNAVCLDAEQWVSILTLADKYEMVPLRNAAVQKLTVADPKLSPVKQIAIARKYQCDELVKDPFRRLVVRKEALSKEEIVQLPPEDLHRLIVEREALQRSLVNKPHISSNLLELITKYYPYVGDYIYIKNESPYSFQALVSRSSSLSSWWDVPNEWNNSSRWSRGDWELVAIRNKENTYRSSAYVSARNQTVYITIKGMTDPEIVNSPKLD